MINVLIPMAGRGSRFREAGFDLPKPLIPVAGKAMVDWALESVSGMGEDLRLIFVALEEDLDSGLYHHLRGLGDIVSIPELTDGAVQSALAARSLIENETPLVIANCDQYIDSDLSAWLVSSRGFDASVLTFNSTNAHHSYIKAKGSHVQEVREKEVISDLAVAGIYYYGRGSMFTEGADDLIKQRDMTNGEYYISPIFNILIQKGFSVTFSTIPRESSHMLGTPEELKLFEDRLKRGLASG